MPDRRLDAMVDELEQLLQAGLDTPAASREASKAQHTRDEARSPSGTLIGVGAITTPPPRPRRDRDDGTS